MSRYQVDVVGFTTPVSGPEVEAGKVAFSDWPAFCERLKNLKGANCPSGIKLDFSTHEAAEGAKTALADPTHAPGNVSGQAQPKN
jgi:hypothetical protein